MQQPGFARHRPAYEQHRSTLLDGLLDFGFDVSWLKFHLDGGPVHSEGLSIEIVNHRELAAPSVFCGGCDRKTYLVRSFRTAGGNLAHGTEDGQHQTANQ
jgi:hypothetical protein